MRLAMRDVYTERVIENGSIVTHFQPIISMRQMRVAAVEALTRGILPNGRVLVSPEELFRSAERRGLALMLDRLCRKRALMSFKSLDFARWGVILFVNLHSSMIDSAASDHDSIISLVGELGLDPGGIAFEITEARIRDERTLERYMSTFKYYGFLIALDDMGKGHSNLNRIPLLKPYLIKIDHSIVRHMDRNFYKQEVFKSIVNLARRIGALVIAEGVETEEEALAAAENGADFLQGFYFREPSALSPDTIIPSMNEKISLFALRHKRRLLDKFAKNKVQSDAFAFIKKRMLGEIAGLDPARFTEKLREIVQRYQNIECAFILDASGVQVTDAVFNCPRLRSPSNPLESPPAAGADHRLKDYYYVLNELGLSYFRGEPHTSFASGRLCVTVSAPIRKRKGSPGYILCTEFYA
jgi:EAL domain-containing protein (putative c-di-GMP-specific phosphodiesterase class I)